MERRYKVTYSISFKGEKLKTLRMEVPGEEELDAWEKTIKFIKGNLQTKIESIDELTGEERGNLIKSAFGSIEECLLAMSKIEKDVSVKSTFEDYSLDDLDNLNKVGKGLQEMAKLVKELKYS